MGNIKITPGIYHDVDFEEYLKWDAVSCSSLKALRKSPAHFKASRSSLSKSTPARKIGSAIHTSVLEPERFKTDYVIAGDEIKGNSKVAKEAKAELYEKYGEDCVLNEKDYKVVTETQKALFENPDAGPMLRAIEAPEVSIVWEFEGVICKGRIDGLCKNYIIDVKSAISAHPIEFARKMFTYGYDLQATFYLLGAKKLDMGLKDFYFLAVEKTKPYGVSVHRAQKPVHIFNLTRIKALLGLYKECLKANTWPCYDGGVYEVDLPEHLEAELEKSTHLSQRASS